LRGALGLFFVILSMGDGWEKMAELQ